MGGMSRWPGNGGGDCLSSMQRELSSLEYSVSHSTQAAPYTHARPPKSAALCEEAEGDL